MSRPLLSLCMIVKNEEASLPQAIASVKEVVDEIIVVDTGSEDRTVEVAKGFGVKVYSHVWQDDFSLARNESIRHAAGRYILWMDADDAIPQDEIYKVSRLKKALRDLPKDTYYFRLVNPIEGGEEQVCMHPRIFPNMPGVCFEGAIHEQVIPSLQRLGCREIFTDITMHHFGYQTKDRVLQKARRNLRILLKSLEQEPDNYYWLMQIGFTYSTLGEFNNAQKYFRMVMECQDKEVRGKKWYPFAFISCATIARNNGGIDIAVSILKDLLKNSPEHGYARFLLGEIYYFIGDTNSAVDYISDIGEEDLRFVVAIPVKTMMFKKHLILGQCYRKLGRFHEAEHEFQICLKIAPDSIDVMLALKNLYADMITHK